MVAHSIFRFKLEELNIYIHKYICIFCVIAVVTLLLLLTIDTKNVVSTQRGILTSTLVSSSCKNPLGVDNVAWMNPSQHNQKVSDKAPAT